MHLSATKDASSWNFGLVQATFTENVKDMETHILFPVAPEEFYLRIGALIEQTLAKKLQEQPLHVQAPPSGLTSHPLLSLKEVCALFRISKPTLYEWISHNKLKPYKIRGKVYFLQADIQHLFDDTAATAQATSA